MSEISNETLSAVKTLMKTMATHEQLMKKQLMNTHEKVYPDEPRLKMIILISNIVSPAFRVSMHSLQPTYSYAIFCLAILFPACSIS